MEEIDKEKLPHHIAIIMDGNGRWAKKKSLNRISGHLKGVDAVREVTTACRELGIKVLTLYAFSIENWKRPSDEVNALMGLPKEYLQKECEEMVQNNIRLNAIGRIEDLPADVQTTLQETMKETNHCDGMILNIALSYGGRSEILHAVQGILSHLQKGKIKPEEITVQRFHEYLWTHGIPDPDLLIRTWGISYLQFSSLANRLYRVICHRDPMAGFRSKRTLESHRGLSVQREKVRPHQ